MNDTGCLWGQKLGGMRDKGRKTLLDSLLCLSDLNLSAYTTYSNTKFKMRTIGPSEVLVVSA